jgi:4-hydroxyphenylacetate 3-monooxygenase
MLMTGDQYRESLRDGRQVFVHGERVADVATHPAFRPMVDARAHVYDMQHDARFAPAMTWMPEGATTLAPIGVRPASQPAHLTEQRHWIELVTRELGGVVNRIGDSPLSNLCMLVDGAPVLGATTQQFMPNIARHMQRVSDSDLFLLSANTDPKGDRSLAPGQKDPDMQLHAVRETDVGITVRGAKFETGAAYAHEAFVRPTVANWGDARLSDYALGFICPMNAPGLKLICRPPHAAGARPEDQPLGTRFDEIDAMIVFDDVLIPWENVFFYRDAASAAHLRQMLHRYAAFPFVARMMHSAEFMLGAALLNVRQTGLESQQPMREKLSQIAVYIAALDAFLTAAIATAEKSPAGYVIPNQALSYAARVHAVTNYPVVMQLARELCGGQLSLMPDAASFASPETAPYMQKYFSVNESWQADDRRRLLSFARDLLNSSHATHNLMFNLFAQAPPFAHLSAVYNTFDWDRSAALVHRAAGLSERTLDGNRPVAKSLMI